MERTIAIGLTTNEIRWNDTKFVALSFQFNRRITCDFIVKLFNNGKGQKGLEGMQAMCQNREKGDFPASYQNVPHQRKLLYKCFMFSILES